MPRNAVGATPKELLMSGPLPVPGAQRRNAATIPTTELPAGGRAGPAPDVPVWEPLGDAGMAWWVWAWSTPQAAAWSTGDVSVVAKRASLEDDLAAVSRVDGLHLADVMGADLPELQAVVSGLARLATGRTQLVKAAAELDRDLGLTPKAMAQLRWKIVNTEPPAVAGKPRPSSSRGRLKVVGG